MKIAIGSDHAGFDLKETLKQHLTERGFEVQDFGTHDKSSCHYPAIAEKVARSVAAGENERGILDMTLNTPHFIPQYGEN